MASPPLTTREYAYFCVLGPGTHQLVSEKLGFSPTDAWSEGDVNPRNGKVRQRMYWKLESGLDDKEPLERHIESLLLVLGTKAYGLRDLWVEYDLIISCVGHYPSTGHGVHLNREVVRQAAQLGITFDMDFYFLEDHEPG